MVWSESRTPCSGQIAAEKIYPGGIRLYPRRQRAAQEKITHQLGYFVDESTVEIINGIAAN